MGSACGQHEGVGNAAAHDELVHLVGQALQDGELGGHLGARHDGGQGALGLGQGLGQGVNLGRQQRAGAGDGCELRNAVGRAFGAVGRTKRVVHEDVAQRGHLCGPALPCSSSRPRSGGSFPGRRQPRPAAPRPRPASSATAARRGPAARPCALATGGQGVSGLNSPRSGGPGG